MSFTSVKMEDMGLSSLPKENKTRAWQTHLRLPFNLVRFAKTQKEYLKIT